MNLAQVARATTGKLLNGQPDIVIDGLCNDSRQLCENKLYVAISGDNFDGHEFIEQAFNAGAVAALAERELKLAYPVIKVTDSIVAMAKIANAWRRSFNIPLLAITGSAGKTTLKEMSGNILSQSRVGIITNGNLNNEIGVPLTLTRLNQTHEFAVIEMGMNHRGEIERLSKMAMPNIAIINNAAAAHLEGLGSIEAVAEAKGEIISGLDDDGTVILNADDEFFPLWQKLAGKRKIVSFGLTSKADVTANYHLQPDGYSLSVVGSAGEFEVKLPLFGEHNVCNALAVIAATAHMGCSIQDIQQGIATYQPLINRGGVHTFGNINLIDDTYNANPASMRAAVDVVLSQSQQLEKTGIKVKTYLIVGDMGELGDQAEALHYQVGQFADVDFLFCYGEYQEHYINGFRSNTQHDGQAFGFDSQQALVDQLLSVLKQHDSIDKQLLLVKGSRYTGMEYVVNALVTEKMR